MASAASILRHRLILCTEGLHIAAFGDLRQLRLFHLEGHGHFLEFAGLCPDLPFRPGLTKIRALRENMGSDFCQIRHSAGMDH